MKKLLETSNAIALTVGVFVFFACGIMETMAQQIEPTQPDAETPQPTLETDGSEFVTINVKDANISEVLKAYSLQTGQSIVVGPDVVSENVNVRLNNIPWQDALDVILKPYGFGYRVVGDTIVISKLENIVTVEGIEPLISKVFTLKYLDAYDIKEVCEAQLSARGKISILQNKGLPGWEFGGGGSDKGSSQSGLGSVTREKTEPIEKSKVLLVTDVPSNVSQIEKVLEVLDLMPSQVLIESRFIEISNNDLMDLGVDFATGSGGLTTPGIQPANSGNDQWGAEQNDSLGLTPAAFDPLTESLAGQIPYNSGLQLLYQRIGGSEFEVLIHALEENGDVNILSAPRILTQNNQEAAILIGEKFPIIESQNNGSAGGSTAVTSTSLSYYENIGIQLNVIPQVCADDYINMIVHPTVSSISGFEQGVVTSGGDTASGTKYPRLKVREAQTQVLLQSGDTVAIGGLQNEVENDSVYGVPFLKDIPFLGVLFRRETTTASKIDLLIMIKATIIDNDTYGSQSQQLQQKKLETMEMEFETDSVEPVEEVEVVELEIVSDTEDVVEVESVIAEEDVVTEEATDAAVENEEILALVNSMDEPTTNSTANAEM